MPLCLTKNILPTSLPKSYCYSPYLPYLPPLLNTFLPTSLPTKIHMYLLSLLPTSILPTYPYTVPDCLSTSLRSYLPVLSSYLSAYLFSHTTYLLVSLLYLLAYLPPTHIAYQSTLLNIFLPTSLPLYLLSYTQYVLTFPLFPLLSSFLPTHLPDCLPI